jgi:prevent-host-death family protein
MCAAFQMAQQTDRAAARVRPDDLPVRQRLHQRYGHSAGWEPAAGRIVHTCVMSESLPITVARGRFGALVRRAAHGRERITITDHGSPAAVLMSSTELEDLEDALALAESKLREATGGSQRVPHEQVRARLGLEG